MASQGQLKIIKYFIKNCPTGEIKDILDDLTQIAGPEIINNAEVK
jgi:hypothetical protein